MLRYVRSVSLLFVLSVIMAESLFAQDAKSDSNNSETPYDVSIPAGTLVQALDKLGAQARMQILYEPVLANGVSVQGIRGTLTFRAALAQLLADTSLRVESVNERTVILKRATSSLNREPVDQMRIADAQSESSASIASNESNHAADESARSTDQMVVEGMRPPGPVNQGVIPRVSDGALPFDVYDREAIERSGATSVGEFLRYYPGNTEVGLGYQFTFGNGLALPTGPADTPDRINLRGLGDNKTVVLLNGRRLYGSDSNGPDISRVPLASIERIEILTGASSAIYGANAVGGAVNIITRTEFSGGEVAVHAGSSTAGGAEEWRANMFYGFTAGEGRTSGNLLVEHMNRSELRANRREYYMKAVSRVPSAYPFYNSIMSPMFRSPQALIRTSASTGLLLPSDPDAKYAVVPAGYSNPIPVADDFDSTAGQRPFSFSRIGRTLLQNPLEIYSANAQIEHKFVHDRVEVYAELPPVPA